jgi:hypothetical protein
MDKPIVYIASPYSKGDPAVNTHFQCAVFDQLLSGGRVIPIAPLWSHFQHLLFPRPYADWITYDQSLLRLYDACLRLPVSFESMAYSQNESSGADAEVAMFRQMGRPVFFSIEKLNDWADKIATR